jgi:uncharacterized protein
MSEKNIERIIHNYLTSLRASGIPIDRIILFGSHTTDRHDEDSDIDLVVVSPLFDEGIQRADVIKLWIVAARVDSRIEPVHCGSRQWEIDDESAILEIARREGREIPAA